MSNTPSLSVVMPVFNEVKTVESVVDAVRRALPGGAQIIIVDDGSVDGTIELLKNRVAAKVDKVLFHEKNQGKGAALRTGFNAATGEIIIIQDADLEYDPVEYPKLLKAILDGRADVVFGSRFVGSDEHRVVYFWHRVANSIITLMSNMFTNLNLTDMETGYKVFRREVIQGLDFQEKSFGFEPEFTAKIARKKWRIYEVGISYSGRTYDEGKKIGLKDAFRALYCIVRYNMLP